MASQKPEPLTKDKAIQVIERFILKYHEVDLLREYLPALKATDFDSLSILFELKNRYHEDLNGILKGDLEWAKYYIGPMMMTRLIDDMAKCHINKKRW